MIVQKCSLSVRTAASSLVLLVFLLVRVLVADVRLISHKGVFGCGEVLLIELLQHSGAIVVRDCVYERRGMS